MKSIGSKITKLICKGMILITLLISSAYAASSGSLILSGIVPQIATLAIKTSSSATNLDITAGMEETIGATSEICNNADGYRIEMYSDNAGALVNDSNPSQLVQYKISYDGSAFIVPPAESSPQVVKSITSLSQKVTDTSLIRIKIDPNPDALSGTYSDRVVLSIIAN